MIQHDLLLAVFNSAHRVMKAESILKRCGLEIMLIPAPRALSTDCGLAIRYSSTFHDSVLQTLTSENILPDCIYRKISDSHYEAIWNPENNVDADDPSSA